MSKIINDKLAELINALNAKGAILIVETEEGTKISQIGLSPTEILDDLCLAIYYAKKIDLDEKYSIDNAEKN